MHGLMTVTHDNKNMYRFDGRIAIGLPGVEGAYEIGCYSETFPGTSGWMKFGTPEHTTYHDPDTNEDTDTIIASVEGLAPELQQEPLIIALVQPFGGNGVVVTPLYIPPLIAERVVFFERFKKLHMQRNDVKPILCPIIPKHVEE